MFALVWVHGSLKSDACAVHPQPREFVTHGRERAAGSAGVYLHEEDARKLQEGIAAINSIFFYARSVLRGLKCTRVRRELTVRTCFFLSVLIVHIPR